MFVFAQIKLQRPLEVFHFEKRSSPLELEAATLPGFNCYILVINLVSHHIICKVAGLRLDKVGLQALLWVVLPGMSTVIPVAAIRINVAFEVCTAEQVAGVCAHNAVIIKLRNFRS